MTYITTEALYISGGEKVRGRISYKLHEPLSSGMHLTHVDLTVENVAGDSITLERVDCDKLAWLAHEAQREASRPVTG